MKNILIVHLFLAVASLTPVAWGREYFSGETDGGSFLLLMLIVFLVFGIPLLVIGRHRARRLLSLAVDVLQGDSAAADEIKKRH